MYICKDCGEVFDEIYVKEDFEILDCGTRKETYEMCPHCGSDDFVEAKQCKICGEFFADDELDYVCDDCVDDYKNDVDLCLRMCERDEVTSSLTLNGFWDTYFSESEVEKILRDYFVKNILPDKSCEDFINNDRDWFGEMFNELRKEEVK